MSPATVVIVNPQSRSGETGERVAELRQLLLRHVGVFDFALTRGPGDATELTKRALDGGAERILVAGGDGTVNEVVNGLLATERERRPELGLLPLGTGRDFARTLKLGDDLPRILGSMGSGARRRVDAGRVTCRDANGREVSRCFLNIASIGLAAVSVSWLEQRSKQGKRGKLSYVASGLVGLAKYAAPRVLVRADGVVLHDGRLSIAAVANGQYFGGGMRVAPDARIDDCAFDVVIVPKLPLLRSLREFPRLMRGAHVNDPAVRVARARVVEAESHSEVWVEADGELVGQLPARVELLEGAITLCGLPD
jgi:diacylglycerol kinase (ATP)